MCEIGGWIKIYRKFLGWEWYDDINTKVLFLHLLLKANIEDKKWHGIVIKRGQYLTSLRHLSKETKLSIKTVRTCLKKLENTGEVARQGTHDYSIITICKYNDYQVNENEKGTPMGTPRAHEGHTKGTPGATTKEYKEEKNIKNSIEKEIKEKEVDPFDVVFNEWLAYKKERRESYNSKLALQRCRSRLRNLSGGDPAKARQIIEQSMANNWAGLFELKTENNNGNTTYRGGYVTDEERDGRALRAMQAIKAEFENRPDTSELF